MEENTQPCEYCGCINFELVCGYYHCSECQTRREDIQEIELEDFDEKLQGVHNTTTTIKQKPEKLEKVKLTTWECYNYVIKELVEELQILGADVLLRSVVKKLWFKYLLKLEVINLDRPKLQAVNIKNDAEVIYHRSRRKKRKRTSNKTSSCGSIGSKREFARKKRLLFNSQLNESQSQLVDNSIMDETLESLKSQSQKSSHSSIPLKFNKYAKRELRRRQSKRHIKKHKEDFENDLVCHRNSYREATKKYQNSPQLLSINKIYTILYLGLLITKSKVQLADMLRFIREGHLSFNNYKHLFPEEINDNFLTQACPKNTCLTSAGLRESAFRMAQFLNILDYIEVQNLALLIERFCAELNLPHVIKKKALSSLIVSLPKMNVLESTTSIPNYEARALSLILFQIKMFFFIDGKTEKYLSDYAATLNKEKVEVEMFNFIDWLQFLDYRKHALINHHFPTEFAACKEMKNSDNFVNFLINKNPDYEREEVFKKTNVLGQDCRNLLLKLKDRQGSMVESKFFKPSLTSSLDHVKILLENQYVSEVEKNILMRNFENCSLDFILKPTEYINLLSKGRRTSVQLGGTNVDINQNILVNLDTERTKKLNEDRKFRVVRVGTRSNRSEIPEVPSHSSSTAVESYLEDYKDHHRIKARLAKMEEQLNSSKSVDQEKEPFNYIVPYECYWVNTHSNLGLLSKEAFQTFFSTFPDNFQLILKEMARIGEQSEQDLLYEFTLTEIYLLYVESYGAVENDNLETIYDDRLMQKIVEKAILHW